jgi:predicted methyltransferase
MTLPRRTFTTALALGPVTGLAGLAGCAPLAVRDDGAALRAAVDGPARSAANRSRDGARHPFETLRFFGLLPTHTVVELAPGGGWYTEILAPYLRAQGLLVAAHYPRDDAREDRRRSRAGFEAKLARSPEWYDRVRITTLPQGPRFADVAPASVDQVLTFRNLHNWLEDGTLDARLQAFHAVLKPGGVFGVVDHRARTRHAAGRAEAQRLPDRGRRDRAPARGRLRAGRAQRGQRQPADRKDHPQGVWSLPPSLRGGDTDRARFVAIGESDRFTHRYRKPG